ncbi:hypothetical protein [Mumia zhuanghuii]|uniref:Uncharacterized protein n=1 Tax=Mumia zhuanghuii TaxID=2585211 RepID=A0A5C4M961_9ACTN|nr:hypothetical protein [Mumia zhuanghuii]TNC28439.1 hypothetical protein FHE65_34020 [Mumia zhuanghuii]
MKPYREPTKGVPTKKELSQGASMDHWLWLSKLAMMLGHLRATLVEVLVSEDLLKQSASRKHARPESGWRKTVYRGRPLLYWRDHWLQRLLVELATEPTQLLRLRQGQRLARRDRRLLLR